MYVHVTEKVTSGSSLPGDASHRAQKIVADDIHVRQHLSRCSALAAYATVGAPQRSGGKCSANSLSSPLGASPSSVISRAPWQHIAASRVLHPRRTPVKVAGEALRPAIPAGQGILLCLLCFPSCRYRVGECSNSSHGIIVVVYYKSKARGKESI